LSDLDGLTGIANRRTFDSYLEQAWKRAVENNEPLSLIMFDADEFKAYNDTYGHQGGDDCLRMLAKCTERLTVLSNIEHLIARYGGEEFAVILCNTNKADASLIAEQIRAFTESLAITHISSKVSNYVTVSLGVATADTPFILVPKDLIRQADAVLYQAKIEGRNRVVVYEN
jgi:diguanylate cyclase (GGDEF)-like protein